MIKTNFVKYLIVIMMSSLAVGGCKTNTAKEISAQARMTNTPELSFTITPTPTTFPTATKTQTSTPTDIPPPTMTPTPSITPLYDPYQDSVGFPPSASRTDTYISYENPTLEKHTSYVYRLHARDVTIAFEKELGLTTQEEEYLASFVRDRWLEWWNVFQGFPFPSYTVVFATEEYNGNAGASGYQHNWAEWKNKSFACQAISHEIFHSWNGDAISPPKWFQEGITQYYGYRGCTEDDYISLMREAYQYYRDVREAGEEFPLSDAELYMGTDRAFFYYAKGALVASILDKYLMENYRLTLDDYLRALYFRYGVSGNVQITNRDLLLVLNEISNDDFSAFFDKYVYGVDPFPMTDDDLEWRR